MDPGHRAAAGLGIAGFGSLAGTGVAAAVFGPDIWMSGSLVTSFGLLVAAAGAAGLHYGHNQGLAALALGCVMGLVGGLLIVGFTMAWGQGTAFGIAATFVLAAAMAQAAWYGVLWWAEPGAENRAARSAAGLRLAFATAAVAGALFFASEFASNTLAFLPTDALMVAGFALAASTRGLAEAARKQA